MSTNFVNCLFIHSFWIFILFNGTVQVSVNPNVDFVEDDKNDQMPPKIQGIRVIVEANKLNEKGDSVHIKTSGGKQSVGIIHTDITVELSDNKTDNKSTEDDSREVPIYLGTDTASDRNNKFDRRYYQNQPNFYGTNDDATKFAGGDAGTWVRFFPTASEWTTEKYYHSTRKYKNNVGSPGFVPYGINTKEFVPCVCSNGQTSWRRIDAPVPPNTRKQTAIDDKLDHPF